MLIERNDKCISILSYLKSKSENLGASMVALRDGISASRRADVAEKSNTKFNFVFTVLVAVLQPQLNLYLDTFFFCEN